MARVHHNAKWYIVETGAGGGLFVFVDGKKVYLKALPTKTRRAPENRSVYDAIGNVRETVSAAAEPREEVKKKPEPRPHKTGVTEKDTARIETFLERVERTVDGLRRSGAGFREALLDRTRQRVFEWKDFADLYRSVDALKALTDERLAKLVAATALTLYELDTRRSTTTVYRTAIEPWLDRYKVPTDGGVSRAAEIDALKRTVKLHVTDEATRLSQAALDLLERTVVRPFVAAQLAIPSARDPGHTKTKRELTKLQTDFIRLFGKVKHTEGHHLNYSRDAYDYAFASLLAAIPLDSTERRRYRDALAELQQTNAYPATRPYTDFKGRDAVAVQRDELWRRDLEREESEEKEQKSKTTESDDRKVLVRVMADIVLPLLAAARERIMAKTRGTAEQRAAEAKSLSDAIVARVTRLVPATLKEGRRHPGYAPFDYALASVFDTLSLAPKADFPAYGADVERLQEASGYPVRPGFYTWREGHQLATRVRKAEDAREWAEAEAEANIEDVERKARARAAEDAERVAAQALESDADILLRALTRKVTRALPTGGELPPIKELEKLRRKALQQLAVLVHPDKCKDARTEESIRANKAFSVLGLTANVVEFYKIFQDEVTTNPDPQLVCDEAQKIISGGLLG